jgi:hypothetical protein
MVLTAPVWNVHEPTMNYIDYEEELTDAFCSIDSCEYEWSMQCVHRPENPMMMNILRSEMFGQQRSQRMVVEDDQPTSRKRRVQCPPHGSPLKNGVREKTRRLGTFHTTVDDMQMDYDTRDRYMSSHQRVVSDDSASEHSVFSRK